MTQRPAKSPASEPRATDSPATEPPAAVALPDAVVELTEEVRRIASHLIPDGLAVGTAGNVSARDGGTGLIAVTPSGVPYESTTAEDIAVVDGHGRVVRAMRRPTSELALHVEVLALRPDVGAIVHTHSPYATAFAVAHHPIPLVANEGMFVGTPRIEVTDFAIPGTDDLGRAAVALLRREPKARAFLLANHGTVALGADLAAAYLLAQQVEWEARIYHHALAIGEPHVLTSAQMASMVAVYRALPPLAASPWPDES
jgi:L-ribulose-5-phosphate 4-epimerase